MIDNETFSRKTVAFHTLGCKLNFSETSEMARRLQERGYTRVDFDEVADIYVINTCSVTEEANKKCRQVIKRCIRRNGDAFVVVTGCYAQLEAQQVADIEGVSLVVGNNEKNDIATLIGNACRTGNARIEAGDIMKDKRFRPSFSSSRFKMVATISVPIAPFRSRVVQAVAIPLKIPSPRLAGLHTPALKR